MTLTLNFNCYNTKGQVCVSKKASFEYLTKVVIKLLEIRILLPY